MRYQMIALSLGLVGATWFASPARGQGHGGRSFAPAGRAAATFSRGRAMGHRFVRMRRGPRVFVGSGFAPNYYPYYDSDYYPYNDSGDEIDEAPPASIREQTAVPANRSKAPESLVMELRGDHWVRLTSYGPIETAGESGESQARPDIGPLRAKGLVSSVRAPVQSELPPAVLVFRDGHQEQVAKYAIVGTTIHIKADYWSTGSWTREIPIAELNVAATLQVNQERGAKFSLPSRPSEVIVR